MILLVTYVVVVHLAGAALPIGLDVGTEQECVALAAELRTHRPAVEDAECDLYIQPAPVPLDPEGEAVDQ